MYVYLEIYTRLYVCVCWWTIILDMYVCMYDIKYTIKTHQDFKFMYVCMYVCMNYVCIGIQGRVEEDGFFPGR